MKKIYVAVGGCIFCILLGLFFIWQYAQDMQQFEDFSELYESQKYGEIYTSYSGAHRQAYILHNLGNTLVQQYLISKNQDEIQYLEYALNLYSGSLVLGEHEDTQYNYDLVEKFLQAGGEGDSQENTQDSESDSQEDQSEQEGGGNGESEQEAESAESRGESADEGASGESGEGEESQNNAQDASSGAFMSPRDAEYYLDEDANIDELSEQEKAELEAITEKLKQEQVYNQQFYNTKEQESEFGSLFDNFFGNIDRGGEKDW